MSKGAKKMIEERKKLGLTQYDLGVKIGVRRSTIACIEAGYSRPTVETAKAIADFLHFDWTLFFEEEDE